TARAISARSTATLLRQSATPRRGSPRSPNICSTISTRRRSTSSRTTTTGSKNHRFSQPSSPICWSTAPAASPSPWRPTSPPHNHGQVIDPCIAYLANPAITIDELAEIVPGPDFPTGGLILGKTGIRSAYNKGRGSILMRGRVTLETVRKEREALIITEIPYQLNKPTMLHKI